jgi:hypothetical protein
MTLTDQLLEILEKNESLFTKKCAPYEIVASIYKDGGHWNSIGYINQHIKEKKTNIKMSQLLDQRLHRDSNYNSNIIEKNSDGSVSILISWKNKDGVTIGKRIVYDSIKEAELDGWDLN